MELKEFVIIKGGKRLPKGSTLKASKTNHPYIKVKDMLSSTIQLNDNFEFVDDNTFTKIKRYIVEEGDVILSIVGTIGNVSIVGSSLNNASLTENCVKFICKESLLSSFLFYYLLSPKGQLQIRSGIVGTTQPKLPIYNIERIRIDVPIITVQQHIVNIPRKELLKNAIQNLSISNY